MNSKSLKILLCFALFNFGMSFSYEVQDNKATILRLQQEHEEKVNSLSQVLVFGLMLFGGMYASTPISDIAGDCIAEAASQAAVQSLGSMAMVPAPCVAQALLTQPSLNISVVTPLATASAA